MKTTLNLLILLLFSTVTFAQDFKYGEIDSKALAMKKYDKDSSAHAVILNEFGSARIVPFGTIVVGLIYECHVRIKFFDSKDFALGTIKIPRREYIYSSLHDEVRGLKGTTYYKDDNGLTQSAELDTTKVFETRENNGWVTLKFAMPAMRTGCIIEYTYQLLSPNNLYIPTWYFQSRIPKIQSEYNVHIPSIFTYNVMLKGPLKLTKTSMKTERSCFTISGITNPCSNLTYGISDIPAFAEEEYTTTPRNFISAIAFELSEYTLFFGQPEKFTSDWKDIDKRLRDSPSFGQELDKTKIIKKLVPNEISSQADKLAKAKAIFHFMQKNFKWNHTYGFDCQQGFEKLVTTHTGDIADINLALVTALRSQGLQADPVLLSTRSNGIVDKVYPTLENFDYVIAKLNIDDKDYFLDATDPLLSFGLLPLRCLNGQGRVINANGPSYWTDLAPSQKRSVTYAFDITMHDDGKLSGTMVTYSAGYSGFEKRLSISSFNNIDEYIENLNATSPKLKITKSEVANVDSLNLPVAETYEAEMKHYIKGDDKRLSFDPFLAEYVSDNPFKMSERSYPVDYGMPSDSRIAIIMHLPAQYKVENYPLDVNYALPAHGGKFATHFEAVGNNISFSYVIQLNKAVYGPEEYEGLKELYNKIILTEKTAITLVKNN